MSINLSGQLENSIDLASKPHLDETRSNTDERNQSNPGQHKRERYLNARTLSCTLRALHSTTQHERTESVQSTPKVRI